MKRAFSPNLFGADLSRFIQNVKNAAILRMTVYDRQVYVINHGDVPFLSEVLKDMFDTPETIRLLSVCPTAVIVSPIKAVVVFLRRFEKVVDSAVMKNGFLFNFNVTLGSGDRPNATAFAGAVAEAGAPGRVTGVSMLSAAFQTYCQVCPFITADSQKRAVEKFVESAYFSGGDPSFITMMRNGDVVDDGDYIPDGKDDSYGITSANLDVGDAAVEKAGDGELISDERLIDVGMESR